MGKLERVRSSEGKVFISDFISSISFVSLIRFFLLGIGIANWTKGILYGITIQTARNSLYRGGHTFSIVYLGMGDFT